MPRPSLSEQEAVSVMLGQGLAPRVPRPINGNAPWPCLCIMEGHEVSPSLANVRSKGKGCKQCHMVRLSDMRRIPETVLRANMLERGVATDPSTPYPGVSRPWKSRCVAHGHEIAPTYTSIVNGRHGCVVCAHIRKSDARRLPEVVARANVAVFGYVPDAGAPYTNKDAKWPGVWTKCGHRASVTYGSVTAAHGCSKCVVVGGLKPTLPSFIYLVRNPERRAIKVGIANEGSNRLNRHQRRGFTDVLMLRSGFDGHTAYAVEQTTIDEWRTLGWPEVLNDGRKYDGYSETVSEKDTCASWIIAQVDRVLESVGTVSWERAL